MSEREYSDIIEDVKKAYEDRILVLLGGIKAACEQAGMRVDGPNDMSTDSYEWALEIRRPGHDTEDVGITLEIVEEREYECAGGYGVSFGLDIVRYGGQILGGFQPFNYTSGVWVDARDPEAVAKRWAVFAAADTSTIPALIMEEAAL